jgi:hypothetical protein
MKVRGFDKSYNLLSETICFDSDEINVIYNEYLTDNSFRFVHLYDNNDEIVE